MSSSCTLPNATAGQMNLLRFHSSVHRYGSKKIFKTGSCRYQLDCVCSSKVSLDKVAQCFTLFQEGRRFLTFQEEKKMEPFKRASDNQPTLFQFDLNIFNFS